MLKTRYRVGRDTVFSNYWAVQYRPWFWPFWMEHGNGMLDSKEEAEELIQIMTKETIK